MSTSSSALRKAPFRTRAPSACQNVVLYHLSLCCGAHDGDLIDARGHFTLSRQVDDYSEVNQSHGTHHSHSQTKAQCPAHRSLTFLHFDETTLIAIVCIKMYFLACPKVFFVRFGCILDRFWSIFPITHVSHVSPFWQQTYTDNNVYFRPYSLSNHVLKLGAFPDTIWVIAEEESLTFWQRFCDTFESSIPMYPYLII